MVVRKMVACQTLLHYKDAFEVELRRLGFGITETSDVLNDMPTFKISAIGFANKSVNGVGMGCAVAYEYRMEMWRDVQMKTADLSGFPITICA
jgi:hypothetical protein